MLRPAAQVAANLAEPGFVSLGEDPQFRLPGKIPPGWYWLAVRLRLPAARAVATIYLDTGHGENEREAFSLPLKSGRPGYRLLFVPKPARVRFDPLTSSGPFDVEHFKLKRVFKSTARKRMQRKLLNVHPRYKSRDGDGIENGAELPATLEALWEDYRRLFEISQSVLVPYHDWISSVEQPRVQEYIRSAPYGLESKREEDTSWPLISVLVPVYNTPLEYLQACVESVLRQTYPKWELCIADDASSDAATVDFLRTCLERDTRIKVAFRSQNGGIAKASNTALALAHGDFIALLDHDDELAVHALQAVAEAIRNRPTVQLIYSDEDKLNQEGERCDPYFKPGFSPDLLLSQNYFSHLGVYRRELVQAVGGFRAGYDGSQDYDLVLRCMANVRNTADIVHVPEVLYHWRIVEGSTALNHGQKSYAHTAAQKALQDYLDHNCPGAVVSSVAPGLYRQHWPLPQPLPLVSLIVPTRDGYEVLRTCIDSILARTTYPEYEILIVDNQSQCPQTLRYLQEIEYQRKATVRVLRYNHAFNYSAINNFAEKRARGAVIGLINNDIEVISPDWLTEMVAQVMRPEIGCVGAKLYYPDGTLQHGGVILGIGGVAGHAHKYFPKEAPGYFSRLQIAHNVSAVTGAVLLVRREVYDEVGGLDEEGLKVAFNDVDFCLRVMKAGYRNVWTPYAELYHHESKTRGTNDTPEKQARFQAECRAMQERWGKLLLNDPHYNPNLSLQREDYSLCMR